MRNVPINPTLENAHEKLRNIRKLELDVSDVMLDFVEYMATIAENVSPYKFENPFIAETIWCLAKLAMDNIKSANASPAVPEVLKGEETLAEIICHKEELFKIIDSIASDDFAKKFRRLVIPI